MFRQCFLQMLKAPSLEGVEVGLSFLLVAVSQRWSGRLRDGGWEFLKKLILVLQAPQLGRSDSSSQNTVPCYVKTWGKPFLGHRRANQTSNWTCTHSGIVFRWTFELFWQRVKQTPILLDGLEMLGLQKRWLKRWFFFILYDLIQQILIVL